MKHFEAEWNSYRQAVLPPDASDTQVRECKRAFFAGAWAFHSLTLRLISPGPDSTDADVAVMESLHKELSDFGLGGGQS